MPDEQELTEFVDRFFDDEINQAMLEHYTDSELKSEIWLDASDHFGHGFVDDKLLDQLLDLIKHRARITETQGDTNEKT